MKAAQPVAVPPEDAERYQLDLWLNPPGFLKAARLPGANPKAIWRWEQIEMGRDGNVVAPEKMHVVSITMLGKYRVEATINPQNQIQRIKTTVSEPAIGDFNIEHESTEQMTFGNVKWPIVWHSHQGWDDNYQFDNASTGHNAYGGKFPKVLPNVCDDPVPVPDAIRNAKPAPATVTVEKMAAGVYRLGGATHNSYMVEFRDFVAVFEAPLNEARSLAVIEEIVKLAPGKPIRWLISSHPHFDHIGGLRTYLHIGATIVAHQKAIGFLNRDVLNYRARTINPDIVALWPPTELSEGYNFEAINENYVITDNSRILRVYYVQPLAHVAGHADGVPAGGADRVRGGSVRHARAAAGGADAGDAQLLQSGAAHEARHRDDRAGARTGGAVERVRRRWASDQGRTARPPGREKGVDRGFERRFVVDEKELVRTRPAPEIVDAPYS